MILKRLATDLRVLLRAMGFGISARKIIAVAGITNSFMTIRVGPQKHQIPKNKLQPNPNHQRRYVLSVSC